MGAIDLMRCRRHRIQERKQNTKEESQVLEMVLGGEERQGSVMVLEMVLGEKDDGYSWIRT